MTDVRCPTCSAHVAAAAQWCGQCYTSLAREPVKPARPPVSSPMALQVMAGEAAPGAVALLSEVPPPPPPPGTIPPPPSGPPAPSGNAKLKLGRQPWPCMRCETVNKYEDNTCSACGKGFLDTLSDSDPTLPLFGKVDVSSRGGKFKIGAAFFVGFCLVLVVVFTIGGLIVK